MARQLLFSKILTKTDIETQLSIFTREQLPFEEGQLVNMHVYDDSDYEWIFPCTFQEDENVGRCLSIGWLEFARRKNLRDGDQIFIYEEVMSDNHRLVFDLKVKDIKGELWKFRFKCRKGIYQKPVLSKGWLQFVHNKDLRVGDKVVFYKKEEEAAKGVFHYKIEVKRKILRLMGQDIWVDVENLNLYGV
ncbi:hypothetical protein JCGZ_00207 [Jatropha curcas]|uniref:TF-B3 domain-containing protein n=1 Tax=Jatropha curcas TaxID=180498 RepID=A0A067LD35_JATCU|nr:hypothetical protein JCGZ_00207 [Jatropha curcas]